MQLRRRSSRKGDGEGVAPPARHKVSSKRRYYVDCFDKNIVDHIVKECPTGGPPLFFLSHYHGYDSHMCGRFFSLTFRPISFYLSLSLIIYTVKPSISLAVSRDHYTQLDHNWNAHKSVIYCSGITGNTIVTPLNSCRSTEIYLLKSI